MNNAAKNIIIKIGLIILVLTFIVFVFYARAKKNNITNKETIVLIDELEDNFLISKDDIFYIITKNFSLENQSINVNTLRQIEETINKNPLVASTDAYIDNQDKLHIAIKQRNPIVRIYNIYNDNFYVDENGIKFFPKNNVAIKVPIVTGYIKENKINNDTISSSVLKQVLVLCKFLNNQDEWKDIFGQINININHEIELIPRIGNSIILLGDCNLLEEKFKRLKIFYTDVLDKVGWNKYRVINIMYKDQVICLK